MREISIGSATAASGPMCEMGAYPENLVLGLLGANLDFFLPFGATSVTRQSLSHHDSTLGANRRSLKV